VPILIVDDNAAKRLALKAVLGPLGHSIVEADSGFAALRCLLDHDFAVILLDVRMPVMDGFETAALIRQRLESEMTPIIFITSYAADELTHTDLYAGGAVDFIFAPVAPAVLRAKVTVFADLFRKARQLAAQAQEVQTSADQFRLLTDAAPIGIFQTDAAGQYVYTNPQWTQITGISAEQALGSQWESILDARECAELDVPFPDGVLIQSALRHRFTLRAPTSASAIVLVTSRPIQDGSGGISGSVGTLTDVTLEAGAQAAELIARDELAALTRLDPLTGLGNRRALQEDLELLEARVSRYGHRYCIALFDVDLFKDYNDTYGHPAGDQILKIIAAQFRNKSRTGDSAYRYGGEEFLCILPEQGRAEGALAAERLRAAVMRLAIPHQKSPLGVLTVSAGLAMLDPGHPRSAADVLKEADTALYRAKKLGRNRVEQPALSIA
jgi:diguanylate cyclase (GGDEF)-like protein/PAS domain S-box-containing protein